MIKINIKKNHIEIKGHAMYDDNGKDIVCAAVSTIVITTINAILRFDQDTIKYKENDGYIDIEILKNTNTTNTLILNMIELLKDLEKQYTKNIKINEEVQ